MIARGPQGPIQRAFYGMIGFLDLKGSEIAPNSIEGVTRPIIDVRPHLLAGLQGVKAATSVHGATPYSTFGTYGGALTVPQGKAWLVTRASAWWGVQPTETLKTFGVALQAGPSAPFALTLNVQRAAWGDPTNVDLAFAFWEGFLVARSGWEFGVCWGSYAGLGDATEMHVQYVEVNA